MSYSICAIVMQNKVIGDRQMHNCTRNKIENSPLLVRTSKLVPSLQNSAAAVPAASKQASNLSSNP